MTTLNHNYEQVVRLLVKHPEQRSHDDLDFLEPWFRKKSRILNILNSETIRDVIQHCEFVTTSRNDVIVTQGEPGDAFYIIVKGAVSVLLNERQEDGFVGAGWRDRSTSPRTRTPSDRARTPSGRARTPSGRARTPGSRTPAASRRFPCLQESERSLCGPVVNTLEEGQVFGELALLSPDSVRTASVVADVVTDLLVIRLDLYQRSMARHVKLEHERKLSFINQSPMFNLWPLKWKRYLAASFIFQHFAYDETVTRQGEPANRLYFIISGEVKVDVEVDNHRKQFSQFIESCRPLLDENEEDSLKTKLNHFSLTNWLSAKSRAADRLRNLGYDSQSEDEAPASASLPQYKVTLSPSVVRRQHSQRRNNAKHVNVSYLQTGSLLGAAELLLGLPVCYSTAVCTQPTTCLTLHAQIFERLFRRKNPPTIEQMTRDLLAHINQRTAQPQILKNVPLLRFMTLKAEAVLGRRTPRDLSAAADTQSSRGSRSARRSARSGVSSSSYPLSREDALRRGAPSRQHTPRTPGRSATSDSDLSPPRPPTIQLPYHDPAPQPPGTPSPYRAAPPSASHGGPPRGKSGHHTQGADTPGPTGHSVRDGIFLKLVQVSNPQLSRCDQRMDDEEYSYLVQLRRRLAKSFEDYYPTPGDAAMQAEQLSSSRPLRLCEKSAKGRHKRGIGPTPGGAGSPHKAALKSARSGGGQQSKSVFFALPKL